MGAGWSGSAPENKSKKTCVYHEVGSLVDAAADGVKLFEGISSSGVLWAK